MTECLDRRGPRMVDCGQGRRPDTRIGGGEPLIVSARIERHIRWSSGVKLDRFLRVHPNAKNGGRR